MLAPPGQHTAFQLDGVLETPRPKQADRGYAAVCTQTNGDDRLVRIELQGGKTVLQSTDRCTHRTGDVAAPPFRRTAHIDNLYGLIAAHKTMKFVGADLGNTSERPPPEIVFSIDPTQTSFDNSTDDVQRHFPSDATALPPPCRPTHCLHFQPSQGNHPRLTRSQIFLEGTGRDRDRQCKHGGKGQDDKRRMQTER